MSRNLLAVLIVVVAGFVGACNTFYDMDELYLEEGQGPACKPWEFTCESGLVCVGTWHTECRPKGERLGLQEECNQENDEFRCEEGLGCFPLPGATHAECLFHCDEGGCLDDYICEDVGDGLHACVPPMGCDPMDGDACGPDSSCVEPFGSGEAMCLLNCEAGECPDMEACEEIDGVFVCVPPMACDPISGDGCDPFFSCVQLPESDFGECLPNCTLDDECAARDRCGDKGVCVPRPGCWPEDPYTGCPSGEACYFTSGSDVPQCLPEGDEILTCDASIPNDCLGGHACYDGGLGENCRELCNDDEICPGNSECTYLPETGAMVCALRD